MLTNRVRRAGAHGLPQPSDSDLKVAAIRMETENSRIGISSRPRVPGFAIDTRQLSPPDQAAAECALPTSAALLEMSCRRPLLVPADDQVLLQIVGERQFA